MKKTATILLSAAVFLMAFSAVGGQVPSNVTTELSVSPAAEESNLLFSVEDTYVYPFMWLGEKPFGTWHYPGDEGYTPTQQLYFSEGSAPNQIGFVGDTTVLRAQNLSFQGMHHGLSLWTANPNIPSSEVYHMEEAVVIMGTFALFSGPDPSAENFTGCFSYLWAFVPVQYATGDFLENNPYAVYVPSMGAYMVSEVAVYYSPFELSESQAQTLNETVPMSLTPHGSLFPYLSMNSPIGANNFELKSAEA